MSEIEKKPRTITKELSDKVCRVCGGRMTRLNITSSFFFFVDFRCEACQTKPAPGDSSASAGGVTN